MGAQADDLWMGTQADDLSLRWVHRSFCWFCHAAVQMTFMKRLNKTVSDIQCTNIFEPHHEKTCLWGFATGMTQIGLLS